MSGSFLSRAGLGSKWTNRACRPGLSGVVGDHPDGGFADVLDDGCDLKSESIAVAEPVQRGALAEQEPSRVARIQVGCGHGLVLSSDSSGSGLTRPARAGRRRLARPAFG